MALPTSVKSLTLSVLLLLADIRPARAFDALNPLGEPKLVLLGFPAFAASLYFTETDPSDRDRGSGDLRSRSWFISSQAGYFRSHGGRETDVADARSAFGFHFRRWLCAGMEFNLTGFRDDEVRTAGLGGNIFTRWQLPIGEKWTPFLETGIGMIFTADVFPPGGTKVNFTPLYGVGFLFRRFDDAYFFGSLRHLHISNGALIAGDSRNPGFDSLGATLGWQFQF
ncbi:MAG: acyloxyacyl hydrolase [Nitrospirae bacterium]|nr:acyloxyacyl hydrolase [Nitrospirota bacterium]